MTGRLADASLPRKITIVLGVVAALLLTGGSAAWATPKQGIQATSAVDGAVGTVTFTTVDGAPATAAVDVYVASYTLPAGSDGRWDATSSPQSVYRSVTGTFPPGATRLVLTVPVPACAPFQLDAALGHAVQATVTFPRGNIGSINGRLFPAQATCSPSPSPSSTPSSKPHPSGGPPNNTSTPPTPTPAPSHVLTVPPSSPVLAATGAPTGALAVSGLGLLVAGVSAVAAGRSRRRGGH